MHGTYGGRAWHTRLLLGAACAALAVAALPGCGKKIPTLVPVRGKLLLDGQPLAGKSVQFSPLEGTPGQGGGGQSGPDGSFSPLASLPGALRDYPGLIPGTYRVFVIEPLFPVDVKKTEQPEEATDPAPAIVLPTGRPARSDIPAKYTSLNTTPLKVEIKQGGEAEITLELQSKP